MAFHLTEQAVQRLQTILAKHPEGSVFRVAVKGGGCSGFQYAFEVVPSSETDDICLDYGQVQVVIDPMSLELMPNGELDYRDELIGAHFAINNPLADASCGCGVSFSVKSMA